MPAQGQRTGSAVMTSSAAAAGTRSNVAQSGLRSVMATPSGRQRCSPFAAASATRSSRTRASACVPRDRADVPMTAAPALTSAPG